MFKLLKKIIDHPARLKDYFLIALAVVKDWLLKQFYASGFRRRFELLQAKIQSIAAGSDNIFLASSYRVDSPVRKEILQVSMRQNFSGLRDASLSFRAADASEGEYFKNNVEFFNSFPNLKAQNLDRKSRLPTAYLELLKESKEKYFCMLFDDMPLVGLTEGFLAAATDLLKDFEGWVDLMLVEQITDFTVNAAEKKLHFRMSDLEYVQAKKKPLAIVKYGNYSFAILKNYHYGFFFNTLIAPCQDYAERLKWYMENVSLESPHKIELAGMRRMGPVYRLLAVPLDVFRIDIDYSHSGISIRGVGKEVQNLFEAVRDGYSIEVSN